LGGRTNILHSWGEEQYFDILPVLYLGRRKNPIEEIVLHTRDK